MTPHQPQHPGKPGPADDHPPLRLCGCEQPTAPPAHTGPGPDPGPRLAHELANLLDGSLRNLTLALQRLNQVTDNGGPADAQALARLHDAAASMTAMAGLLKGWMTGGSDGLLAGLAGNRLTLGQAVEHALGSVRPVAIEQNIQLNVDLPPACADLPAGPLQPVLLNGLRNAIEAVERDGQVWLSVEQDGHGWLTLRIADDGPGLDAHLPRDRDGLVLPGTTTKANGQGLGLAISRDLVRAIGGVIRLDDRPGGGAELLLRIPLPNGPARTLRP